MLVLLDEIRSAFQSAVGICAVKLLIENPSSANVSCRKLAGSSSFRVIAGVLDGRLGIELSFWDMHG